MEEDVVKWQKEAKRRNTPRTNQILSKATMFEKKEFYFFVKQKRIVNKTRYKVLAHYEKLNSTNTLKEKQEALMQFRLLYA